jgi:hypothetical protein
MLYSQWLKEEWIPKHQMSLSKGIGIRLIKYLKSTWYKKMLKLSYQYLLYTLKY